MDGVARWVRTVGQRAPVPAGVLILAAGVAANAGLLQGAVSWVAVGLLVALVMTIPLAAVWAHVPGETAIERRARGVQQARAREDLAAANLRPEQYIAKIPGTDVARRVDAAEQFGVDLRPKCRVGAGRVRLVGPPPKEGP